MLIFFGGPAVAVGAAVVADGWAVDEHPVSATLTVSKRETKLPRMLAQVINSAVACALHTDRPGAYR
jgi:hypothetical protein